MSLHVIHLFSFACGRINISESYMPNEKIRFCHLILFINKTDYVFRLTKKLYSIQKLKTPNPNDRYIVQHIPKQRHRADILGS